MCASVTIAVMGVDLPASEARLAGHGHPVTKHQARQGQPASAACRQAMLRNERPFPECGWLNLQPSREKRALKTARSRVVVVARVGEWHVSDGPQGQS